MPRPPKRGGEAFHAPCRSYPECRHKKHGYTRKDRPAPKPRTNRLPPRGFDDARRHAATVVTVVPEDVVLPEEVEP